MSADQDKVKVSTFQQCLDIVASIRKKELHPFAIAVIVW